MLPHRQALWLVILLLTGCAALGILPADTFDKRTYVAIQTVAEVRHAAGITLQARITKANADLAAGVITENQAVQRYNVAADDAENIQGQMDKARAGIEVARELRGSNPVAADQRLEAIATGLRALQSYLRGNP